MPAQERLRLDDHKRRTPGKVACQAGEAKARIPIHSYRLCLTPLVEGELRAQEEIFGDKRGLRSSDTRQDLCAVQERDQDCEQDTVHAALTPPRA
jgi:hypothetical protein